MKKRVLIFSTNYLPNIGGAEIAIKEITDRIPDYEYEFEMICPRYTRRVPKTEIIGNITVNRVGLGFILDKFLIAILGVIKGIQVKRRSSVDLVWCMMASQGAIAGSIFSMATRRPMVLTLQEGDEEHHLMRYVFNNKFLYRILIKPFYSLPFKVASYITAISEYLEFRGRKENKRVPIEIIPNGVDIKRFTNVAEDQIQIAKDVLKKGSSELLLITVSRLVKKNAIIDLVSSLPLLPENVRLIVIGDGNERSAIEERIAELQIEDKVMLLGSVPNSEIPAYLHACDIFIRPSISEGQGISFIEAMAAGLPIVAPPVGGIVDFLREKETGVFCQIQNIQSIAAATNFLLENPNTREVIVSNAKKLVDREYDWNTIAPKMKEVFDRTLE